jgi:hypothetical protein
MLKIYVHGKEARTMETAEWNQNLKVIHLKLAPVLQFRLREVHESEQHSLFLFFAFIQPTVPTNCTHAQNPWIMSEPRLRFCDFSLRERNFSKEKCGRGLRCITTPLLHPYLHSFFQRVRNVRATIDLVYELYFTVLYSAWLAPLMLELGCPERIALPYSVFDGRPKVEEPSI